MRGQSYAPLMAGLALLMTLSLSRAGEEFKLEPGFTLLFNGKNLDGWQTKGKKEPLDGKTMAFKGKFKAEKGVLALYPIGSDSSIETAKEFAKDVHIKLDFKPGPKCNNDFLFRGTKFDIVPGKAETKDIKEGEWSTLEIIATGGKIVHKLNGETARKTSAKGKSSTFVIRSEYGAIEIKNIRVKEGS